MRDNLIKRKYNEKISLIEKYNKFYYDKDQSIISDQEFDLLKKD